jgi:uncharacterized membrane protein YpjA
MKRAEFIERYTRKEYIGDGVYAHFDGYHIILTTMREEGEHTIALEPSVFTLLCAYQKRLYEEAKKIDE